MNKRLQSIIVRAGHFFARSNWLPAMRMLAAFVILGLPPVSHAEAERESVVITGDSAGASCRRVAVGLVKYQLHHSWFAGMTGWGRGKPKVTDMRAELYVYDRHDRKLSKMLEIEAPRKWREDTQFELTPRILPDGEIIFMLRGGCGNGNQSCRESRHFKLTGPFRSRHGQACYLFNPAAVDYRTHRYNPLSYISSDPNFRIDDVQKIANMLFPDMPGVDVIWTATPRSLFLGIVLMLAETPGKPVTLGQVVRESLMEGDGAQYFARLVNERAATDKPYSNACVRALNSYISITAENTRAGVMTSFRSRLELWMNPLVDAATSENDFDLRDVRKRRMSVYLGVTPDNLERMAPLLNLFFQQLIDLNTRELPNQNAAIRHSCLLLMDEFTAIGKIGILSKGISYIAGYGLRMLPIIQSPAQLVEVYGQEGAQNFTTNHALNIIFPPKASESQTAKEISEWLGNQTVSGIMLSKPRSILHRSFDKQNLQISDQQRPLLLPQEITGLGSGRELIVVENTPPILASKVVYYKDKVFIDRLRKISPSLRSGGAAIPSKRQMDDAIRRGELAAGVPRIDLEAHHKATGGDIPLKVVAPPAKSGGATVKRPVTAEDIANMANLNTTDFSVDFSQVKKPEGELTEEKLKAYADDLCRAMGMQID